jgi:hypothetical protein
MINEGIYVTLQVPGIKKANPLRLTFAPKNTSKINLLMLSIQIYEL